MKFLLTNDDGVHAPGLKVLAKSASELGEVVVVAPATQQSGISHRVTFERPLQLSPVRTHWYSVDGTPADCVRVALSTFGTEFDWVLSGINDGANLGVDVYYSGTVAAAREATFFGIKALAMSQYRRNYTAFFDWQASTPVSLRVLRHIFGLPVDGRTFFNINLPDVPPPTRSEDVEIVECQVDPSPLVPDFQETDNGLVPGGRYADRRRIAGQDIDVCFAGGIAVSRLEPPVT